MNDPYGTIYSKKGPEQFVGGKVKVLVFDRPMSVGRARRVALKILIPWRWEGEGHSSKQRSKIKCDATGRVRWVTGSGRPRERRGRSGTMRLDEERLFAPCGRRVDEARYGVHVGGSGVRPIGLWQGPNRVEEAEARTRPILYVHTQRPPRGRETRPKSTQRQRKTKREEVESPRLIAPSTLPSTQLALICVMMPRDEKGIDVNRGGKYLRNKSADGGVEQT
ncbi:hypothetical protein DFH08DRAFT_816526 [Mycena albidolilacea]|uniref:Uncharacterized protein n=1 Tax=Mycena albidolilacea TaxID=1033008 RepID=A0AAD7EI95_9AGAR|nr:hypothetical protein DFH08DRAFT_816526 [Mycena albidolilacea]